MSGPKSKGKSWRWFPSIFVYDSCACTKEEDDPANAVIYHEPKNIPLSTRTALCGQLAGVVQFCKLNFAPPTIIKTKWAYIAFKYYDRYMLVVCGPTAEWAKSRLREASIFLEASIGDFKCLWKVCNQVEDQFKSILTIRLDAIVAKVLPEIGLEACDSASSPLSSTVSSMVSPISDFQEDGETDSLMGGCEKYLTDTEPASMDYPSINMEICNQQEDIDFYDRELSAIPSLSLPKSGSSVFLKAQQLLEACQYEDGVIAGTISFRNKTLSSQIDGDLWEVITSLNQKQTEKELLGSPQVNFKLPKGVTLNTMYIQTQTMMDTLEKVPKHICKKIKKKSLHDSTTSKELSSLRAALQNNSIHTYPSHVPPLIHSSDTPATSTSIQDQFPKGPMDPLLLCAKISRHGDFLSDGRPSRSLPGSPRKIRVSTMLPDVGNNSPQLKYKVLASKMPKPISSTHNTPKRLPANLKNKHGTRDLPCTDGKAFRGTSMNAPSLKRKEYFINTESQSTPSDTILDPPKQKSSSNHISSSNQLDIKNTKNKLNLQFAPDTINRPSDDSETKISRELNGSLKESNNNQIYTKAFQFSPDEEDSMDSDASDISVLELNSLIQTEEAVDKLFKQATMPMTPGSPLEFDERPLKFDSQARFSDISTENSDSPFVNVVVLQQQVSDTVITLLLNHELGLNATTIYELCHIASKGLPDLNSSVLRALEISADLEGDAFLRKSFSVLSGVDVTCLNPRLVVAIHRHFCNHPNLMEITLKNRESVVWGNRLCSTETYYQSSGVDRPGLPIPSDAMARIPHKARKALERDHTITIL